MTKTLQEIQQENRKFILEAIHGCSYEEALKKEYAKKGNNTISVPLREYEGEELTLSRVLLALKDKQIGYYDDGLGYIVIKKRLFSVGYYDEVEYICDWDLTKETLEEQSEETQRRINKLFND